MKKLIKILALTSVILSLVACSGGDSTKDSPKTENKTEATTEAKTEEKTEAPITTTSGQTVTVEGVENGGTVEFVSDTAIKIKTGKEVPIAMVYALGDKSTSEVAKTDAEGYFILNTGDELEGTWTVSIYVNNIEIIGEQARIKEGATPDYTFNMKQKELSLEQKNAIKKANSYISHSAFSKSGLIKQLEFEKFSPEASQFAVDNIKVDWVEQAGKKAESYMKHSSFSKEKLIDQLKFEGFTQEEAEAGAKAVGY